MCFTCILPFLINLVYNKTEVQKQGVRVMEKVSAKDKFIKYFTKFSRLILYLLAVIMLLWLNSKGLVNGRQWFDGASDIKIILVRVIIFVGVLVLSVIAGSVMERFSKNRQRVEWIVLGICCLIFGGICIWWVSAVPYKMDGDQLIVWYNAVLASQNEFPMYTHGGQMYIYPQQQGLSFLYELLFRITGSTSHRMIGYLNASLAPFTLFFGYQCVKECFRRKTAVCFLPFMMLCLPYIIYSPYVYGDIPSICFSFILLWAILRAVNQGRYRYYVVACMIAAVALMCRMNMWIFFIGAVIGLVYFALQRWSLKPIILGVCIVLCASIGMSSIKQFNSYRSGEPVSEGMPAILWVAMGLQFSEWGAGYYNHYSKGVYQQAGFDKEIAAEIGRQEVKERIDIFLSDPYQRTLFFDAKMRLQWLDPLFESIKFTGLFEEQAEEPGEFIVWIYQGEGYNVLSRFCADMMAAVYFFALFGVVSRFFEKRLILQDIPLIVFVGGFLFSIVWEAKARYMLPYYVLLLMYAANGVVWMSEIIKTKFIKYKAGFKN